MIPARKAAPFLLGSFVVLIGALASVARPAGPQDAVQRKTARRMPPELYESDMVTRHATCRWAALPPVLDGKLDDRCWQKAAVIDHFASFWTNTPRAGTFAYLVWDNDALYYAASMTDTELRAYGTKRNDTLWEGDVFELFFKPSSENPQYFEFQANPKMLVFEMAFSRRGQQDVRSFLAAAPLGSKAVVALKGTLDRPGDKDQGWTVEGRIPWSAFATGGGRPKPGDEWFFALCRYDYGPVGTEPVTMSSAPLTTPSFHRYEDYGKLRFEGAREGGR